MSQSAYARAGVDIEAAPVSAGDLDADIARLDPVAIGGAVGFVHDHALRKQAGERLVQAGMACAITAMSPRDWVRCNCCTSQPARASAMPCATSAWVPEPAPLVSSVSSAPPEAPGLAP